MVNVGIVGVGTYLPKNVMTAKEISDATGGVWSEDAVRAKLGIKVIQTNADQLGHTHTTV